MKKVISFVCLLCCIALAIGTFTVPASAMSEEAAVSGGYDVYKAWYTVNYSEYSYFMNEFTSVYEGTILRHENSPVWKGLEAAWRVTTFNLSSEVDYAKKEYGYYEALLFNLLYDENSDSLLQNFLSEYNDNVSTTNKIYKASGSSVISKVAKLYEKVNDLDFDPMRKISEENADEVKKIFDMAASCKEVQEACKILGDVGDIYDNCSTLLDLIEGICKVQAVVDCQSEINQILRDMYAKCTDVLMKQAISNFITYTSSSITREDAILLFMGQTFISELLSEAGKDVYKKVVSSLGLYGYAVSAGQAAGKFTADALLGTSDALSSYYDLRAVYRFENLIKSVVSSYGYSDSYYAKKFNAGYALLLKTRIYGIDKYIKYLDKAVYGGGLAGLLPGNDPDDIATLLIPGTTNEDVARMMDSLRSLKECLKTSMILTDEIPLQSYNYAKELYGIECADTITLPLTDVSDIKSSHETDLIEIKGVESAFKSVLNKNWVLTKDTVIYDYTEMTGGTIDLNGHTLTIYGNFYQKNGAINFNGGTLIVKGDYHLNGYINLLNSSVLSVDGDLIAAGDNSSYNATMIVNKSTINIGGDYIVGYVAKDGSYAARESRISFYNDAVMNVYGDYIVYKSQENYNTSGIYYYNSGCINIYGNKFFVNGSYKPWGSGFNINFHSQEPVDIECKVIDEVFSQVNFNAVKDNQTITIHNNMSCYSLNGNNLTVISDSATLLLKNQPSPLNVIGDITIKFGYNTSDTVNCSDITVQGNLKAYIIGNTYIKGKLNVDGNLTVSRGINSGVFQLVNGEMNVSKNLLYENYGSIQLINSVASVQGDVDFYDLNIKSSVFKAYGDSFECQYVNTSEGGCLDFYGKNLLLNNSSGLTVNLCGSNDVNIRNVGTAYPYITINSVENAQSRKITMSGIIRIAENPVELTVYSDGLRLYPGTLTNDMKFIGDTEIYAFGYNQYITDITFEVIGNLTLSSSYFQLNGNATLDVHGNVYSPVNCSVRNYGSNNKMIIRGETAEFYSCEFQSNSSLDFYGSVFTSRTSISGSSTPNINFYGSSPLQITATAIAGVNVNFENIDSREISISCPSVSIAELTGTDYVINSDNSKFTLQRIIGNVTFNGNVGLSVTTAVRGDITVNGDLSVAGNIQMNGYSLSVNGNMKHESGTIDVNRGVLAISGNLTQTGGTLNVNGGKVNIAGNYMMAKQIDENTYSSVSAALNMTNAHDVVTVGGDMFTYSGYLTASYLKAGRLEIAGDLTQYGTSSFICGGTHETILNGNDVQHITFENSNSSFNLLYLAQSVDKYVFVPGKCWITLEDSPYILPEYLPEIWSIYVTPQSLTTDAKSDVRFSAVIFGKNVTDSAVIWTISGNTDENTKISSTGLLSFGAEEKATEIIVTATAQADTTKTASATLTVFRTTANPVITSVVIEHGPLVILQGDSELLKATILGRDVASCELVWSVIGNRSHGTEISEDGLLVIADDERTGAITVRAAVKGYEQFFAEIPVRVVKLPEIEVLYGGEQLREFGELPQLYLSQTSTPGIVYLEDNQMLVSGTYQYRWIFEPEDSETYAPVSGYITLSVSPECSHEDADTDAVCDICEEKIEGIYCEYCNDYHTGFFAIIIKFFHSLMQLLRQFRI